MATLETIWNDTIKLRDANKGTPIEKHCEMLLSQMNTAGGRSARLEALQYILSIENGTSAARLPPTKFLSQPYKGSNRITCKSSIGMPA